MSIHSSDNAITDKPLHTCPNCGSEDVDVNTRAAAEFAGLGDHFHVGDAPLKSETVSAKCRRCGWAAYVAPGCAPPRRVVSDGRLVAETRPASAPMRAVVDGDEIVRR